MVNKQLNKKGLLARDYLIMLVLFSAVAGIGALLVMDISSSKNGYNVENISDPTFSKTYNRLSETSDIVDTSGNQTRSGLSKLIGSGDGTFFSSTLTIFNLLFGSVSMINSVFVSFTQQFGVPQEIANIIFPAVIIILTIIIIFVIASSLTRSKI